MSDKKLSEAERDRLASNLQKKLKRERLRPGLWFLAVLPILGLAVFGVWRAVRMPDGLPPVMLVCYDALGIEPNAVEVKAQLIAPGHPNADLADQEIFWETKRNGHKERSMFRTEGRENFFAQLRVDKPVAGETIAVKAWFIDPQAPERGRDDQARVDILGKGVVQVALIEEVADAEEPIDWLSEKARAMPVRPEASKALAGGTPTVYISGEVSPTVYRAMRSWLWSKFDQKDGLPAGVLLRNWQSQQMKGLGIEVKKLEPGK